MKRSREHEQDLDSDSPRDADYPVGSGVALRPVTKFAELDSAVSDENDEVEMRCSLPPHREPIIFNSYDEYEAHYNKYHTNRCLECRKNFPSEHLMCLHIEECHDPLVVIKRERGEHTYSCFVEGCERKCLTYQKRRLHLIDKHIYPKNFFFGVTKDGIDGRRSLLVDSRHHRRRSSATNQSKGSRRRASVLESGTTGQDSSNTKKAPDKSDPEAATGLEEEEAHDEDMEDLTGALSALQFVPPSVRFGRGRAGFAKR